MKKALSLILALVICFSLCACGGEPQGNATTTPHTHDWKAATCSEPMICKTCGATEGSANSHSWKNATCTAPKTCKTCGATEGSANGHSWKNATCTAPKTCSTCNKTEGSANGHSWKNATCTAPKTCKTCGATEGAANGHNYTKGKCSICGASDPTAAGIVDALRKCERYVNYIDINADILLTTIDLYKINGKASLLVDMLDKVLEIDEYCDKIQEYCKPYKTQLYPLYSQCELETPLVTSSNLAKVKTFATLAGYIKSVYNSTCSSYNVSGD